MKKAIIIIYNADHNEKVHIQQYAKFYLFRRIAIILHNIHILNNNVMKFKSQFSIFLGEIQLFSLLQLI